MSTPLYLRTDGLTVRQYALMSMVKSTGYPTDLIQTALALRAAKTEGPDTYRKVLAEALAIRADRRRGIIFSQRDWQTKVSRRPQRGRHHDSWTIRERYVRCSNSAG